MIFASTMLYAIARKLGLGHASEEFMRQVRSVAEGLAERRSTPAVLRPSSPPAAYIPAAYTIARLALLDQLEINVNAGATVIAKGRNISAHAFLESRCDVWVSCDDDVEVSDVALAAMVEQCKASPCFVIAPCLLRDTLTVNVEPFAVLEASSKPLKVRRVAGGGWGCVAVSREALEAYAAEKAKRDTLDAVSLGASHWTHTDGVSRAVLFRDEIERGHWYTEDTAFFRRVPRDIGIYAARVGHTVHNGQILDLETLEALVPKGDA